MLPRRIRYGLAAFMLLSGAAMANLMLMQPGGGRGAQSERNYRGLDRLPGIGSTSLTTLPQPRPATDPRPDAVVRASPADDAETTRAIQRELTARNYHPGTIDGIDGLVTRGAIMAFEHDHGLPLTATPSEELLKQIMLADPRAPSPPRGQPTMVADSRAEQVVRTVQQSLTRLGYQIAEVDGRLSPVTEAAIRKFESDHKLKPSGRISGLLVARLAALASQGKLAAGVQ